MHGSIFSFKALWKDINIKAGIDLVYFSSAGTTFTVSFYY